MVQPILYYNGEKGGGGWVGERGGDFGGGDYDVILNIRI